MIFTASDGIVIHCKSFTTKQAKASLMVVHGLGEHLGRYSGLVELLLEQDVDVHLIDLRGHGCSEGLAGYVTDFAQFHLDIEYWWKFLKNEKILNAELPVFLLGHSLGGLIVCDFVLHNKGVFCRSLSGMALSAPALGVNSTLMLLKPIFDFGIPSLISKIHIGSGIDASLLTHDKKKVAEYLADPLVHGKITPSLFRGMLNRMQKIQNTKSSFKIPALFLIPDADQVTDQKIALKVANAISAPTKDIVVLNGFYHEVFNEKKRDEAFGALFRWIRKCLGEDVEVNPKARKRSKSSALKSKRTNSLTV